MLLSLCLGRRVRPMGGCSQVWLLGHSVPRNVVCDIPAALGAARLGHTLFGDNV